MPDISHYGETAAVVTTILGLFVTFAKWLKPLVENAFRIIPEIKDLCSQNTVSVVAIAKSVELQADSFKVLARVMSQTHIQEMRLRTVLLLVEDSKVDGAVIRAVCEDIIRRFRLSFVWVTTLDEAITQVSCAAVAVLDIMLDDGSSDDGVTPELLAFIAVSPCPMIIHSATEYKRTDFPNAHAVVCKGNNALLKEAIESAILNLPAYNYV